MSQNNSASIALESPPLIATVHYLGSRPVGKVQPSDNPFHMKLYSLLTSCNDHPVVLSTCFQREGGLSAWRPPLPVERLPVSQTFSASLERVAAWQLRSCSCLNRIAFRSRSCASFAGMRLKCIFSIFDVGLKAYPSLGAEFALLSTGKNTYLPSLPVWPTRLLHQCHTCLHPKNYPQILLFSAVFASL